MHSKGIRNQDPDANIWDQEGWEWGMEKAPQWGTTYEYYIKRLVYGNVRSLLLLGGSKICHSSRLGLQGSNICRGVYIVSWHVGDLHLLFVPGFGQQIHHVLHTSRSSLVIIACLTVRPWRLVNFHSTGNVTARLVWANYLPSVHGKLVFIFKEQLLPGPGLKPGFLSFRC